MIQQRSLNPLPVLITLLAVMAVTLRMMGRSWWCACGTWSPWSWDIWSSHNSQHLLDPYFFTHVLHGVALFWILRWLPSRGQNEEPQPRRGNAKLLLAMLLEIGWEILENSSMIIERYREATISLDYFGDSIANSVFDVLACLLGYVVASKMRWYGSLAMIGLIELGLLLTIRDSLLLNIVMLVHPIEAIKLWQTP